MLVLYYYLVYYNHWSHGVAYTLFKLNVAILSTHQTSALDDYDMKVKVKQVCCKCSILST